MAIFMVVPTEDAERLARLVSASFEEENRFVLPGKQACFVRFAGTTQELSAKLDLDGTKSKTDRPCPAVITLVNTYGGYAPSSLWEWLKVKSGA